MNIRNVLERVFCLFFFFEKSVCFLKEKNKYEMKIYYYEFEEVEIILRIFYLGRDVVVI